MKTKLTQERLKELMHYDPDTGIFTWIRRPRGWRQDTLVAGATLKKVGYFYIGIDGKRYPAHRLAWLYMTGKWPEFQIDHIDNDGSNNQWLNFREADKSQNAANSKKPMNNTSGSKGVSWDRSRDKWQAKIRVRKKTIHLGRFDELETAAQAYRDAAIKHFGEYARTA